MKHTIYFYALALLGWFLAPLPEAFSHDPGLSRANVQLRETGLAIHMVFARQDIEVLMDRDTERDHTVTEDENAAARNRLQSAFAAQVEVRTADEVIPPRSVRIQPVPDDALQVELDYEQTTASAIQIHMPLLAQLARGHRQHLTVRDANDNLLAQFLLDASSRPILLEGSGTNALSVLHQYLVEGVWHIWFGFDHILFLVTLLLPALLRCQQPRAQFENNLRPSVAEILKVVTAFTVAHSITLVAGVLEIVTLPQRLVESVIALSVLVTAVNNLRPFFAASRWLLAFAFGLVHGFGFASVLVNLGLPNNALIVSLLGFNLGVEAGQLVIVAMGFPLAALLRDRPLYRTWVLNGGSSAAALIATIWMFERLFDYEVLGL